MWNGLTKIWQSAIIPSGYADISHVYAHIPKERKEIHMKKFLGILLAAVMLMTSVVAMADTFEGVGTGMGGELKVTITVEEGKITAIEATSHNETAGISDPAFAQIPQAIIDNQSLAVDAVAGATMTSNGLLAAVEAAAAAAGLDVEALKAAEVAAAEVTYATELTADVVVVGAGGAGLAAATAATQNGASVIVVEKMGTVGGNSIICGGIYNSPDAELQANVEMSDSVKSLVETALAEAPVSDEHAALQAAVKADFDAYVANGSVGLFDSANWYALQTWNGGDKVANLDLVKVLANNSYPGLQWLKDLGMEFSPVIGQGAGSLYQRTHGSLDSMGTGYIKVFMETVGAENVLTNTKGESLIKDETGRVVGVKATNPDGTELTITANKGVVIATGGFSANVEMREKYNTSGKWPVLGENIMTTNAAGITGDGIAMASEAGANLVDMEQIQLLYLGNPFNGGMTRYTPRDLSGTDQIIFVNKEGKRFVQEDGRRDVICTALIAQTDGIMYILESGDGDAVDPDQLLTGDGYPAREAEAEGYLLIADTLEEMAAKIGCDYATLQATVDSFNAAVKAGEDEFGRKLYSTELTKGPWIACARVACVHHTMGGIQINTNTEVLDTEGNVIPGLYAAGEVTGGLHGANRLGGNAIVDFVVFGKLAGENAAK